MQDKKYCYPNSDVLINKKNIRDIKLLREAEMEYTLARLYELQMKPIKGKFGFAHLKKIHEYIFQDLYSWAGKVRTVNISKGQSEFCVVQNIDSYAESIFSHFASDCERTKNDKDAFVSVFTSNYADMNALHPFREGNGRTQREFARELCSKCGYVFDLSHTSHTQMLDASVVSFQKGDNAKLFTIFQKAIVPENEYIENGKLNILSVDDLDIEEEIEKYDYYE